VTEPAIYLITGPMAAGKSTVARLLASRFQRGVHLDAARFRQSIVRGREQTTAGAIDKLGLCQRLAASPPTPMSRRATRWGWRTRSWDRRLGRCRPSFGLPVHYEDDNSAVFRFGQTLVNLLDSNQAPELVAPVAVADPSAGVRMQFTLGVADVDSACELLRDRELARRPPGFQAPGQGDGRYRWYEFRSNRVKLVDER
jgi:hypothetical protein